MADRDLFGDPAKLLAAFDCSAALAAQEERSRARQAEILLGFIGAVDGLEALEQHCRELSDRGLEYVPLRSVQVLCRQSIQTLGRFGVSPVDAVGRPLDLDLHEVVATTDNEREKEDVVVRETRRGYLWNGKLLRRSKVVIGGGNACTTVPDDGGNGE